MEKPSIERPKYEIESLESRKRAIDAGIPTLESRGIDYLFFSKTESPKVLKDTDGNPMPSGITPKIFVGGDGSGDEYPVGSGCTNQRKSTGIPDELKKE